MNISTNQLPPQGEGWEGALIRLTRPHHWIKNLFVLLPVIFGGSLLDAFEVYQAIVAFFAFSFIASSIYCFNDIIDVEADRRHTEKRHRPIASGKVSITQGYIVMIVCIAMSFGMCALLRDNMIETMGVITAYFVMEIFYCISLKRYAVIDVCILAMGFVLRIITGGFATSITPSHWLVLMTFLIALLMAFGKRRDDVLKYMRTGIAPRHNTKRYNLDFINQAITVNAAVTLVCYIMYTVTPAVVEQLHCQYAYLTTVFVILGLYRYMQLASVDEMSGDPTKLVLHDRFLQTVVLLWLTTFIIMIYVL